MTFPVSGLELHPLVPVLVGWAISSVLSLGGISGAFLLLPFQVSVLGFSGPAVTPTNHLFNVVAIPVGLARHVRERRMVWPLAGVIVAGSLPGSVLGSFARVTVLASPHRFQLFMALVLLLVGSRIVRKIVARRPESDPAPGADLRVEQVRFGARAIRYRFSGREYRVSTLRLGALSVAVGAIGGAYGVGGGALMAPFLIGTFGLPVHTIAGATLLGTFVTSAVSVASFSLAGLLPGHAAVGPDWLLGLAFGLGGLIGIYTGARLQRFVPARAIELLLALVILGLACGYLARMAA